MNKNTKLYIKILSIAIVICLLITGFEMAYFVRMGKLAKNMETDTQYVIMTSYLFHRTLIYDKENDYKIVKSFKSCGARDKHRGKYKLSKKIETNNGSVKDKDGNSVYHYYYVYYYKKLNKHYSTAATHSILYNGYVGEYQDPKLYHNTKDKIQNRKNPFSHHWSNGCTRLKIEDAKWIYDNCGEGTGYGIIR